MTRAIIRCLFGNTDSEKSWEAHQHQSCLDDVYDGDSVRVTTEPTFEVYVAGLNNLEYLQSKNCYLDKHLHCVDNNPWPCEKKHLLRNKIHLIGKALEEYDEVLALDWDCACLHLPEYATLDAMWADFSNGAPLRSLGWGYIRRMIPWRVGHERKVANTGALYARRDIWPSVESAWETTGRHLNDEVATTFVMDALTGGWQGVEKWSTEYGMKWARMGRQSWTPDWLWKQQKESAIYIHFFRAGGRSLNRMRSK